MNTLQGGAYFAALVLNGDVLHFVPLLLGLFLPLGPVFGRSLQQEQGLVEIVRAQVVLVHVKDRAEGTVRGGFRKRKHFPVPLGFRSRFRLAVLNVLYQFCRALEAEYVFFLREVGQSAFLKRDGIPRRGDVLLPVGQGRAARVQPLLVGIRVGEARRPTLSPGDEEGLLFTLPVGLAHAEQYRRAVVLIPQVRRTLQHLRRFPRFVLRALLFLRTRFRRSRDRHSADEESRRLRYARFRLVLVRMIVRDGTLHDPYLEVRILLVRHFPSGSLQRLLVRLVQTVLAPDQKEIARVRLPHGEQSLVRVLQRFQSGRALRARLPIFRQYHLIVFYLPGGGSLGTVSHELTPGNVHVKRVRHARPVRTLICIDRL